MNAPDSAPPRFDFARPELKKALADVYRERMHQQDSGKSDAHSLDQWLTILGDEYGQACRAAIVQRDRPNQKAVRRQLVCVAAVALAAIERLDRLTIPADQAA